MIQDWDLFLLTKERCELGLLGIVMLSNMSAQTHCDSDHMTSLIYTKWEKEH